MSSADGAGLFELAILAVLLLTLTGATYHDMTRHRIPNALVLIAVASALVMRSVASGPSGIVLAMSGGLIGLVVFLPFYLLRAMGAGDVKLMAGVGTLLGPTTTLLACGLTLIAGALIATAVFVYARYRTLELAETALTQKFPYAIAIATGSVVAVVLTGPVVAAVHW
jgi:prepilin peptidase CpaA